ncbi:MAG: hypothetical protein AAFO15_02350 [Pseudomonadota bacterium]
MFFIVLYALYLFYIQENNYARVHILVLIDSIFFSLILVSCLILSNNWMMVVKYLFLWVFIFLSSVINISFVSNSFYNLDEGK